MNFGEPEKLFWIVKRYDFEEKSYKFSQVLMSESDKNRILGGYSHQRVEIIPCRQDDIPFLLNYLFMGCEKLSCNSNEFLGKLGKLLKETEE